MTSGLIPTHDHLDTILQTAVLLNMSLLVSTFLLCHSSVGDMLHI